MASKGNTLVVKWKQKPIVVGVVFVPSAEFAQYGVGTLAVAGIIYIGIQVITSAFRQRANSELAEVVQNNTKALEQVAIAIQNVQINMARQEAKLDELLERARR